MAEGKGKGFEKGETEFDITETRRNKDGVGK
jgi:hypothetical protein